MPGGQAEHKDEPEVLATRPEGQAGQREALEGQLARLGETLAEEIRASYSTLMPDGDFSLFSPYNIPLDKARIAAAGLVDPGPARPPYQLCPPSYLEGAAEAGRRWAALQQKYAAADTAAVPR